MKNFIDWLFDKEDYDDLPFEMTKEDIINWVKKIHECLLSDGKKPWDGKHYGECTKQNFPCELCLYQMWLNEYKEYCINFKK